METQSDIIEQQILVEQPEQKRRGRPKKIVEDVEPKPKPKLGRPLTSWRHREDGTYNSRPIDPEYAKQYWRTHYRQPYTCPICDAKLNVCGQIKRHEQSLHCQLAKLQKQQIS